MTTDDHWAEDLRCPRCKKTGTAQLSQANGQAFHDGEQDVRVDSLPDGFKVIQTDCVSMLFVRLPDATLMKPI